MMKRKGSASCDFVIIPISKGNLFMTPKGF